MKHLSVEHSRQIAELITSFRGTVTWSDVVRLAKEVTGEWYTRQTLEKREEIRTAYDVVKSRADAAQAKKGDERAKPVEIQVLVDRVEALAAKNEFLEKLNTQLREQFVVWAENARKKGLTDADLNCPLVAVSRNASK